MVDLCHRFGRYRMYLEHEKLDTDIGRGLAQRQDALSNFLRTGGLAARTSPCRRSPCARATSVRSTRTETKS